MKTYLVKGTVLFNFESLVEAESEQDAVSEVVNDMEAEELMFDVDEEEDFHVEVESVKVVED